MLVVDCWLLVVVGVVGVVVVVVVGGGGGGGGCCEGYGGCGLLMLFVACFVFLFA